MSSVLILDDRPADRELNATLLRYAGYVVREAASGEEALELARADRPDLVITDILMPSMNGYEFVRRLRADPDVGGTPVIFCTANYVEGEVRRLAEACGVYHFISKPSDPATVVSTVGEVLGSPRSLPERFSLQDFDREQLRLLNDKLFQKVNDLEAANAERQKLVGQLFRAHEEERKRIAEDLHDDSIQTVMALGMRLETLAGHASDPEIASELGRLQQHASLAVDRLRRLLFELQPVELDRQDLRAALEVCLERAREEDGLEYGISDRTTRLPAEATATLLYRMAREALSNVRRHADASRVDVLLCEEEGDFLLVVSDDGKGFCPVEALQVRPGHLGLPSMRERVETAGGSLRVESRPGNGSTVEIRIPELGPRAAAAMTPRMPSALEDLTR